MSDIHETVKLGTVAGHEDRAFVQRWLIAGAVDYMAKQALDEMDDAALFRRTQAAIHAGAAIANAAAGGSSASPDEIRALRNSMCDMSSALIDEIVARDVDDEQVVAGMVTSRHETVLQFAAQQYPQLFDEDATAYDRSGLDLGIRHSERMRYLVPPATTAAA